MMNFIQKAFAVAAIGVSAVGSPSLAGEADKGFYATGSVGYSQIQDIDVETNIPGYEPTIKFDSGVGFDLGLGYDFGNIRLEATWDRITSTGGKVAGVEVDEDTTVNGYLASIYYDFDNSSKWTPFIGGSLGSVNAEVGGEDASSFYYGIQGGVSYEVSDQLDIIGKVSYLRANDLDYDALEDVEVPAISARLGVRFTF